MTGGILERELIRRFIGRYRPNVTVVLIASLLLNLLVFTGSLYMMLVYDAVLPSHSLQTLGGLFVMLCFLYLFQAGFEVVRAEALLGVANGVQADLFEPVHHAAVDRTLKTGNTQESQQLTRDLDQVHSFLSSTGPVAIIDLPWVILFLLVLFALHWTLGLAALLGTVVLAAIAWATARRSAQGTQRLLGITGRRLAANQAELRFAESAMAMGMQRRLLGRSADCDRDYVEAQSYLSRTVARLGGAGRVFRLFLQSLILTVGALLVLDGKASGGIIIGASILAGRAFAPVDQAIANWRGLSAAREGWGRIVRAIAAHRIPPPRQVALAAPQGEVVLRDVWVAPPGAKSFVVSGVSLTLKPGQALAIIGPSAAGKTTLAKALLGIWPAARGEVRIDGATHDQWEPEAIGAAMGYVPQNVELIEGSIGQNIARFDPAATSEAVIAAARAAGMHDIILGMPDGYETRVSTGGPELSAGQRQRIGLARALYGDPFLVVLDEPNSNLDAEGDTALAQAILGVRERGGVVVMITHRPATLGPVSHVAVINAGRLADFGERDAVLERLNKGAKPAAQPPAGVKLEGANG
ncbi:MAG TPA: type I secretion system permease/ATPase [Novosphingobium sp.]|nr:type I secretion system permease/ATPase [Novosphingobium sp.]